MSKRISILFLAAIAAVAVAVGAASASTSAIHVFKSKSVTIAMRDPGCHWFADGGKYYTAASVQSGTTFRNLDEATLIFKGQGFTKLLPVGKTLRLTKAGTYHVTMVKQAPDDNHLLLIVK